MLFLKAIFTIPGGRGIRVWLRLSFRFSLCVVGCVRSELEALSEIENMYITKSTYLLTYSMEQSPS
jgi:hypothetical protein